MDDFKSLEELHKHIYKTIVDEHFYSKDYESINEIDPNHQSGLIEFTSNIDSKSYFDNSEIFPYERITDPCWRYTYFCLYINYGVQDDYIEQYKSSGYYQNIFKKLFFVDNDENLFEKRLSSDQEGEWRTARRRRSGLPITPGTRSYYNFSPLKISSNYGMFPTIEELKKHFIKNKGPVGLTLSAPSMGGSGLRFGGHVLTVVDFDKASGKFVVQDNDKLKLYSHNHLKFFSEQLLSDFIKNCRTAFQNFDNEVAKYGDKYKVRSFLSVYLQMVLRDKGLPNHYESAKIKYEKDIIRNNSLRKIFLESPHLLTLYTKAKTELRKYVYLRDSRFFHYTGPKKFTFNQSGKKVENPKYVSLKERQNVSSMSDVQLDEYLRAKYLTKFNNTRPSQTQSQQETLQRSVKNYESLLELRPKGVSELNNEINRLDKQNKQMQNDLSRIKENYGTVISTTPRTPKINRSPSTDHKIDSSAKSPQIVTQGKAITFPMHKGRSKKIPLEVKNSTIFKKITKESAKRLEKGFQNHITDVDKRLSLFSTVTTVVITADGAMRTIQGDERGKKILQDQKEKVINMLKVGGYVTGGIMAFKAMDKQLAIQASKFAKHYASSKLKGIGAIASGLGLASTGSKIVAKTVSKSITPILWIFVIFDVIELNELRKRIADDLRFASLNAYRTKLLEIHDKIKIQVHYLKNRKHYKFSKRQIELREKILNKERANYSKLAEKIADKLYEFTIQDIKAGKYTIKDIYPQFAEIRIRQRQLTTIKDKLNKMLDSFIVIESINQIPKNNKKLFAVKGSTGHADYLLIRDAFFKIEGEWKQGKKLVDSIVNFRDLKATFKQEIEKQTKESSAIHMGEKGNA